MEPRQELVLKLIVDEYIRHAVPVGSKWLAETHKLDVSPATIRNDMGALERAGYIEQPHTSAGRVPTEKAYVYYLRHFVEPARPGRAETGLRAAVTRSPDDESAVKTLARTLMELSGEMAIVAFDPRWSYYTGMANLFQKPEFHDLILVQTLSALVDRFDEVIGEVFDRVPNEPQVMIGSENPFGRDMAAILVKYTLPSRQVGILGLVGPIRMDYAKNIGLVEEAMEVLDEEQHKRYG